MKTLQSTLWGILCEVSDRTFPDANKKDKRKKKKNCNVTQISSRVDIRLSFCITSFYRESRHCHILSCFMSVAVYVSVCGWLRACVCAYKNPDYIEEQDIHRHRQLTKISGKRYLKQTDSNHIRLINSHNRLNNRWKWVFISCLIRLTSMIWRN